MTDGYLTEERHMMQQAASEFTTVEVLPVANALDPEKGQIPRDLIDKMGEMKIPAPTPLDRILQKKI